MDQLEVEGLIKDLNTRTKRIEQILPTLATKQDVADVRNDLAAFATKEDLKAFATKDDLKAFPTRDEVKLLIEEEGKRTRRHFDVVAEGLKESIKVIADGHNALNDRITTVDRESRSALDNHERRITNLEASKRKRRQRSGRN
jgi:hypothetical protein